MKQLNDSILAEYYRALDPEKRREVLAQESISSDPSLQLRTDLYRHRYLADKKDIFTNAVTDNFLRCFLDLIYLYRNSGMLARLKAGEAKKLIRELCLLEEKYIGNENGRDVLYWEFRNTASRYFSTCRGSGYYRKVFGIISSSEEEKDEHMRSDAWCLSYGIAGRFGLESEMAILCEAVDDEFCAGHEDVTSLAEQFMNK